MPFPSLNSTWARHRTRGRLHTFLWIQEISQTWCVAKFQFECDYRVSSGPFYQPVNSRTESHQNKPNTGEKSHFCLWFSEKDSGSGPGFKLGCPHSCLPEAFWQLWHQSFWYLLENNRCLCDSSGFLLWQFSWASTTKHHPLGWEGT